MRMKLIGSGRAMAGGSDGGARLDRMLGSVYPTELLADTIRGRRLLGLEQTVRLMTDVPARLFGLRGRGRVEEGWQADLVLFGPDRVGCRPVRKVADLPADRETPRSFGRASGCLGERQSLCRGREGDGRPRRDGVEVRTGHRDGQGSVKHSPPDQGWSRRGFDRMSRATSSSARCVAATRGGTISSRAARIDRPSDVSL